MQERVKVASKARPKPTTKARSKRITLEIDAKLAAAAAQKGIDLAAALEHALRRSLNAGPTKLLDDEEREAMEAMDSYVREHGSWTEGLKDT